MAKSSRGSAFKVLCRVCAGGYADILLESELALLVPEFRPLATELVYGVLRWQGRLDYIIRFFSSVKPEKMEHKVLNALRLGVYQLFFIDSVPVHAAINESVELVRALGRKRTGFVNGVLRKISTSIDEVLFPDKDKEPVRHIAAVYSHPEWIVCRWIERYGIEETVAVCKTNLTAPPKSLRVNTLAVQSPAERKKLIDDLADAGFSVTPGEYTDDCMGLTGRGRLVTKEGGAESRFYLQDAASQLVSCLLGPVPGAAVLDACAAPGGKSSHIAALMENSGRLYAVERNKGRVKVLKSTLKRLEVTNAVVLHADSELPLELGAGAPEVFDFVLCDAPCSGLGVLRRAPDIKLRRVEADLVDLASRQKRLLNNLSKYVAPGGVLVYSVCSNEPVESVEIVDAFVSSHQEFSIENCAEHLSASCASLIDDRGFLRTYPHRTDLDGFFAARLKRTL